MNSERKAFLEWVKKEHPHIYNGSLRNDKDSIRFKMDIDFMFSAWQASAQRQGYKLVPVEPTQDMINKIDGVFEVPSWDSNITVDNDCCIEIYKAMIGAFDD